MSILNVENLSFGFGDKTLFKDVSFRLLKGEHVGLVGSNGAGKTTFLNILTGKLVPDDGTVSKSSSVNVGYLDQHWELADGSSIYQVLKSAFSELYMIEEEIMNIGKKLAMNKDKEDTRLLEKLGRLQDILYNNDFYSIDSKVGSVAKGLGLDILDINTPVDKLSGGQRMKVKLGWLLLGNPELLLLDEPTNYLDKEHIDWLSDYLKNYSNSFIVISHDTNFLNDITNVIYHIEFTTMKRYPGNYDAFLRLKDDEEKRYIEQYNRQQKEISKLEEYINKNIASAATSTQAKSRRKKLNKIERLEKPKKLPAPRYSFTETRQPSTLIFECKNMNIGYNYPIIKGLNLELKKGEKVAITGCNGIGKSTLLKTIMGILSPLDGVLRQGEYLHPVYFEQETKISSMTPMEEVWKDFPLISQWQVREALARCGLKQEHVLRKMSSLSGGEQSKVRLCKLMMTPSNWLLLDEPTNHLDSKAKDALNEALISFDGTILLVCHEKSFYQDWVTDEWNLEEYIYSNTKKNNMSVGYNYSRKF